MGPRTITGAGAGVGERSVSMSGVGVMADVQAASGLWDSTSLPGSSAGAAAGTAVGANTGWSPGGGNRTASGLRATVLVSWTSTSQQALTERPAGTAHNTKQDVRRLCLHGAHASAKFALSVPTM